MSQSGCANHNRLDVSVRLGTVLKSTERFFFHKDIFLIYLLTISMKHSRCAASLSIIFLHQIASEEINRHIICHIDLTHYSLLVPVPLFIQLLIRKVAKSKTLQSLRHSRIEIKHACNINYCAFESVIHFWSKNHLSVFYTNYIMLTDGAKFS